MKLYNVYDEMEYQTRERYERTHPSLVLLSPQNTKVINLGKEPKMLPRERISWNEHFGEPLNLLTCFFYTLTPYSELQYSGRNSSDQGLVKNREGYLEFTRLRMWVF